ncbi:hypothetical protein BDB00DRAFT_830860 [Zychaea mexicana]|uniref:uncharacterized protein n=1 Tax=Zychaea mexicana TaxID=64656 RepID=UPI0022FED374|nr:uncharacterized protein BDB00DRAFT_830860 [Zychaea mexicana]KAI9491841.1 hypothetical protein BDB00DRAFT_830860 [Zychaea mexicana]
MFMSRPYTAWFLSTAFNSTHSNALHASPLQEPVHDIVASTTILRYHFTSRCSSTNPSQQSRHEYIAPTIKH